MLVIAEQPYPGSYIEIIHDKGSHYVSEREVLDFIEKERMNVTDVYGGNSGSGEPWNELPAIAQTQDARDYLDDNWDTVIEQFWKAIA